MNLENMSKEEINGMFEAYEVYKMLPDDKKAKIPEEFVKEMEECYKVGNGEILLYSYDIEHNASPEGLKCIAKMLLYVK